MKAETTKVEEVKTDKVKEVIEDESQEGKLTQSEMEKHVIERNKELLEQYLQQGPFVYELYGIMIH